MSGTGKKKGAVTVSEDPEVNLNDVFEQPPAGVANEHSDEDFLTEEEKKLTPRTQEEIIAGRKARRVREEHQNQVFAIRDAEEAAEKAKEEDAKRN